MRRGLAICLAMLAGLASTAPTTASRGVAVDIGAIEIHDAVTSGRPYDLPKITVSNPGSNAAMYVMLVRPIDGAEEPRSDWLAFEPRQFALAPGDQRAISVRLNVSSDARPSTYEGLLVAQLADEGSGALVGAAAAVRLTFQVRSGGLLPDIVIAIGDAWSAWMPWSLVALTALAAMLAMVSMLLALRRRYSIRLERRRR
jgi:hypothetical protein